MAHTAWKGGISIGLLVIPVKLHKTTSDTRVEVHQVTQDGTRIRYRRVKEGTREEVPYGDIRKGAELSNGQVVVLDDEEYAATLPGDGKSITIIGRVPVKDAPAGDGTTWWAHPDTGGEKAYNALARALAQRREALVARIVLKDREHLAVITAREGRLWVATIPWPEDLLAPDLDAPAAAATPAEVRQMGDLLGAQPQGFTWASHPEPQREKVAALISASLQRGSGPTPAATMPAADLGDMLRRAVEEARRGRQPASSQDGGTAPASPGITPLAGKSARKAARPAPASQGATAGRRAG